MASLPAEISPEKLSELDREVRAELCRRSLAEFIREGWHVLEPGVALDWNWHIEFIADHVQAMLEDWICKRRDPSFGQRAQRCVFNVPPGTGKSRIVSVFAPAWMWLHDPSWRVLCLSANPDVALRDADYSRQLIESEWYREWFRPPWSLRKDQDAKTNFGNTEKGQRVSKGMKSKITGVRFDAHIIDDPNDLKEIHSEAIRNAVNNEWDNGIRNRLNDARCSIQIGIMQRGHEGDWSGHVIGKGGWEHVCLPMEYEKRHDEGGRVRGCKCDSCERETTFLGQRDPRTEPGEVLHSERFTPEVLERERKELGTYGYAGQMQQRPTPADGGMFKRQWFGRVQEVPEDLDEVVVSADCASKKTTDGSNTALVVLGRKGVYRYILDAFAGHLTTKESAVKIIALKQKWGARRVLVEDKAAGPGVVERLKEGVEGVNGGKGIAGVISITVGPNESKESRAMAVQPEVESGCVMILAGQPWEDAFLGEVCAFPLGTRDDQVDALTQALNYWRKTNSMERFRVMTEW